MTNRREEIERILEEVHTNGNNAALGIIEMDTESVERGVDRILGVISDKQHEARLGAFQEGARSMKEAIVARYPMQCAFLRNADIHLMPDYEQ